MVDVDDVVVEPRSTDRRELMDCRIDRLLIVGSSNALSLRVVLSAGDLSVASRLSALSNPIRADGLVQRDRHLRGQILSVISMAVLVDSRRVRPAQCTVRAYIQLWRC